jgi:undecaprenyl-diphosphatase
LQPRTTVHSLDADNRHRQLWLGALATALILTAFTAANAFASVDARLANLIQDGHKLDLFGRLSEGLYRFGLAPVFPLAALAAAGVAALWRNYVAGAFILIAAASRPLGTIIKELVERPRPSDGLVQYVEGANGFSYPSGHVFGTVLLVGFIAYVLIERQENARWRFFVIAAAASVILLMGLQRVYAGAHWPTDALGAYLWGGLVLFGLIQAYRRVSLHFALRSA